MSLDSILNTLYLTFAHNQYAIAFFIGAGLSFLALLVKPSRTAALLLIAFISLFIGFEYDKHIMEPLMAQTLESLEVDQASGGASLLLVRIFQKLLPFAFFTVGWGILFFVIFYRLLFTKKVNQPS